MGMSHTVAIVKKKEAIVKQLHCRDDERRAGPSPLSGSTRPQFFEPGPSGGKESRQTDLRHEFGSDYRECLDGPIVFPGPCALPTDISLLKRQTTILTPQDKRVTTYELGRILQQLESRDSLTLLSTCDTRVVRILSCHKASVVQITIQLRPRPMASSEEASDCTVHASEFFFRGNVASFAACLASLPITRLPLGSPKASLKETLSLSDSRVEIGFGNVDALRPRVVCELCFTTLFCGSEPA
ncbi:hypothetical protein KP509_08G072900 [Ceratopteris richardii]|uniref:Uncharacterized protein n=1 Tax=Ceratopteris richardii TaxID=49495 RepID=A0A8T2U968_CERRI|nr:hypothetical protein KP509_08G072900 [Ceratopteris richardii]